MSLFERARTIPISLKPYLLKQHLTSQQQTVPINTTRQMRSAWCHRLLSTHIFLEYQLTNLEVESSQKITDNDAKYFDL